MAAITGYSRDVLLHLRSVANGRHVVAKQTAELIKAYGLRRPRRRRGCRAGRRAKPRPPAATSALDRLLLLLPLLLPLPMTQRSPASTIS